MNWESLLSCGRLGAAGSAAEFDGVRSPFQRDFDRILFSSPFRRLQDKTQVFPLAKSDYVRTRLTHSLEVSSVGRSLGVMAGDTLIQRNPGIAKAKLTPADIGTVVATACLAHDIGNPPFGHAGESAIQHWFSDGQPGAEYLKKYQLSDTQRQDFEKFEGNAQGFRVLTRLQFPDQLGGMQLTYATLGTFTKYPRRSNVDGEAGDGISGKKFGFVEADQSLFEEVARALGLTSKGAGAWKRHPLAFLMEAADDICYRIMDVEDGFRTGHLRFEDVEPLFISILEKKDIERIGTIDSRKRKVEFMRAKAINVAIKQVVDLFLDSEQDLLSGKFEEDLLGCVENAEEFKAFRTLAREKVYSVKPVIEVEACGYRVIAGLLEALIPAIENFVATSGKPNPLSKTLLNFLPEGSFNKGMDAYQQLLAVTDCVSGMTDSYALTLYQRIHGISLP